LGSGNLSLFILVAMAALLERPAASAADPSPMVARVGFVGPLSTATIAPYNGAFWKRLPELGWVEGQNLSIEARSADGHLERLPALIAEVIDRKVDVLVTYGSRPCENVVQCAAGRLSSLS
jgi:putative ABC transport system substrate-binding protein